MTTIPPGDQCKTCTTAHAHLSGLTEGKSVHTLDYFLGKYPCCRQAYDTLRAHSPAANPFDDDTPAAPFHVPDDPPPLCADCHIPVQKGKAAIIIDKDTEPRFYHDSCYANLQNRTDGAPDRKKDPGAQIIPGPRPELTVLPQPVPQPYPLWVTFTNAGVTASHCLVLAWQHHPDPEQIQILIGGCNGPEWVTPAQWEKTKFETDGTVGIRIEGTER